jgi:uncharacterized damage-inducible protein DinB
VGRGRHGLALAKAHVEVDGKQYSRWTREFSYSELNRIDLKFPLKPNLSAGRIVMRTINSAVVGLCFVFAIVSRAAFGQAPAPTGSSTATGVQAEVTKLMDDAETKLTKLAQAIPPEKFSWRPEKDARSVSEVFLHVAGANFFLPGKMGTQPPADFKFDGYDKSTSDKTKVIDELKKSFAHVKQAIAKLTEADLVKTAPWFGGGQVSYRYIAMFMSAHQHEHLGQSIAYARSIGIVPPWTVEQQQRQKQQPKPKT